jgi:Ni/Co efflux regulator RcnB
MTSKTALTALVIAILASNEAAFAQGKGNNDRNDRGRGEERDRDGPPGQRDRNARVPEGREFDGRNDNRRDGPGRGDYGRRGDERGAGPNHSYYRGDRLPLQYRHRQYAVDDWRGHNLSAPPRGYHWVQNGADYLLVGIATGMILQIFLSR